MLYNIQLLHIMQVYILDNLQLPNIGTWSENIVPSIRKGYSTRMEFSMIPIVNEQNVKSFSIKQRNCRFSHEIDKNSMFKFYTSDTCAIEVKFSINIINIIYIYLYIYVYTYE